MWFLDGSKVVIIESEVESEVHIDDEHPVETGKVVIAEGGNEHSAKAIGQVNRLITVGKESVVYAWTPEEVNKNLSDEELKDLMEARESLGCMDGPD